MTREQRSAQAAGIGGLCLLIAFVVIPVLAYLSAQLRHVMPPLRDWLIAHTEAAHLIVFGWVA